MALDKRGAGPWRDSLHKVTVIHSEVYLPRTAGRQDTDITRASLSRVSPATPAPDTECWTSELHTNGESVSSIWYYYTVLYSCGSIQRWHLGCKPTCYVWFVKTIRGIWLVLLAFAIATMFRILLMKRKWVRENSSSKRPICLDQAYSTGNFCAFAAPTVYHGPAIIVCAY